MALHPPTPTAYFTSCLICCSLHPSATFVRILPISTSMLTMETVPQSNSYYWNCHLPIFILLSLIHTEQTRPGCAGHVGSWTKLKNIISHFAGLRFSTSREWPSLKIEYFAYSVGSRDFFKLNVTSDFKCNFIPNIYCRFAS